MINRNHSLGRRHFSIAHELFHVLTWSIFHPTHIASEELLNEIHSRSEKLANCFAAGLLMPSEYILPLWRRRNDLDLKIRLEETAELLMVSPDALFWRLVTLRQLKKCDKPENWDLAFTCSNPPKLYSKLFAEMIHDVISKGKVSVRKTLNLLDCQLEDLTELLLSYSLPVPFEL